MRDEVSQKHRRDVLRRRKVLCNLGRLQLPVERIFFLAIMRDPHIDFVSVYVERGVNGGRQLAMRGWQEMVRGVQDGELGQQRSSPGVLVRARAEVDVLLSASLDTATHIALLFRHDAGEIPVPIDESMQIGLEKTNHVHLHIANKLHDSALAVSSRLINAKMDLGVSTAWALRRTVKMPPEKIR